MIIDSVIWIALKHSRDRWHDQSIALEEIILDRNPFFITDNILTETYNYLLRKVSLQAATETYEFLINSQRCQLLFNNMGIVKETFKIMKDYPRLSYTDANMVWHAKNHNFVEIMSFDQGFDGIPGIQRIFYTSSESD